MLFANEGAFAPNDDSALEAEGDEPGLATTTLFAESLAATTFDFAEGTGADEDIRGTRFDDDIFARGGADLVRGRGGADLIDGGGGGDDIYGGSGRDSIWGGRGLDVIYGGKGRDDFWFDESHRYDKIRDFQAGDTLVVDGQAGDFEGVRRRDIDIDHGGEYDRLYVDGDLVARIYGDVVIEDDIFLLT